MQDTFVIKLHAFKYLEMKTGICLRFSLTWEFCQASTGGVYADTSSGNLAWIDKETGEIDWSPHLTGAGYRKQCYHTISKDLDEHVREQLEASGHMQPLIEDWIDQKKNTILPPDPAGDELQEVF